MGTIGYRNSFCLFVIIILMQGCAQKSTDCLYEKAPELSSWWEKIDNSIPMTNHLDICNSGEAYVETFIEAFSQSVEDDLPPYLPHIVPNNDSSTRNETWLNITEDDIQKLRALKHAHIVWMELSEKLNWTLNEMSEEMLAIVFNDISLRTRDDGQNFISYVMYDNPRWAYNHVQEYLSMDLKDATPQDIAIAIIESMRTHKHGVEARDGLRMVSMQEMHENKISYYGCHTNSAYIALLGKTFLLPSNYIMGWYDDEYNHGTAIFPMANFVLAHGDDVYSGDLKAVPSDELMDSYTFWQENVFPHGQLTLQAEINAHLHKTAMAMKYPSSWSISEFCFTDELGKTEFINRYELYSTTQQRAEFERTLRTLCL